MSAHAARSIIPYGTRSVKNNLKKVSDFYAAQLQQPHADKAAGKPEGEPGGHIPDMVHAGEHPHHPLYLRKDSTPEPFDVENYLDTCF